MKKQRLGKGLSALIPQDESGSSSGTSSDHLIELDVAVVKPNPYQPRLRFNPHSFEELKKSLREKGLIQPITVRRVDSHYELIAGERRLRAAIEVGINKIPAYIIEVESKEEMLELALIENVQRERLNPIEQAHAFQRLISECSLTQDEVAQKIGKERSTITNILRLLRLPTPIQKSLEDGQITLGHARTLVSVEDPEMQSTLCEKIIKNDFSVRKLERIVKDLTEIKSRKTVQSAKKSIYIQKVEEDLRNKFGTKVSIRSKKEGGSVEIEFYSPEDLNRLIEIFDKLGS
jgi:ParB family chromosome partitioning protein